MMNKSEVDFKNKSQQDNKIMLDHKGNAHN